VRPASSHRTTRALAVLLALATLALAAPSVAATPGGRMRHVLLLNSYHPTYAWTANIVSGVRSVFDAMDDLDLNIEFMDTKKVFTPAYADLLARVYGAKYANVHFDLILSSDDDALDFLKTYRDQLFPGVPVVFCGVNNFTDARIAGFSNVTGVNEYNDLDKSFAWIASLRPATKQLVFVLDQTATSKGHLRQLDEVEPRWKSRFSFTRITDATVAELEQQLKALPPDAVVFWDMFMRDRANVPLSLSDSLRLVARSSPVPVFGAMDATIAEGITGGYVVSGFSQGQAAARLGQRVLAGTAAGQIPVVRDSPNVYMVDYPVMKRWGFDVTRLPPGTVVLNEPFSVYWHYRRYIWAVLGGMGAETLVIVVLLAAIRRLTRKSRAKLRASEERYRSIVEDGSEMICRFDPAGQILFVNGAMARLAARPAETLLGQDFWSLLTGNEQAEDREGVEALSPQEAVHSVEQLHDNAAGGWDCVLWTYRALFGADGRLSEVQAVGHDITARREAEEALRTSIEKVEVGNAELRRANRNLQGVLDSMSEGLVVCDRDGRLSSLHSKAAVRWFGEPCTGTPLVDYLFEQTSRDRTRFQMALRQIADDVMPFEVSVDQLPRVLRRGDRAYSLVCHQRTHEGAFEELVFTIADITQELQQEQVDRLNHELPAIVGNLMRDREGFEDFVDETEHILGLLASESDRAVVRRLLHTLKGNTAIYGFEFFSSRCHAVEDAMAMDDAEPSKESLEALTRAWNAALGRFSVFLTNDGEESVRLARGEYEDLLQRLESRADYSLLLRTVREWAKPSMSQALGIHARTARQLATRLGKEVETRILDNGLRLPSPELRPFLGVLVHLVRNAVDHGIERPLEREQTGKPRAGQLTVECRVDDTFFVIAVEDDGRGIDWEAVRRNARRVSLPVATEAELVQSLFADGLTTREVVSEVSGRGVGLVAVRRACEQLGGSFAVSSQPGRGTRFEFRFQFELGRAALWPAPSASPGGARAAAR